MQWLDEAAGMVAMRHTRTNVITASVDNLRFIHGAYNGEMIVSSRESDVRRAYVAGSQA